MTHWQYDFLLSRTGLIRPKTRRWSTHWKNQQWVLDLKILKYFVVQTRPHIDKPPLSIRRFSTCDRRVYRGIKPSPRTTSLKILYFDIREVLRIYSGGENLFEGSKKLFYGLLFQNLALSMRLTDDLKLISSWYNSTENRHKIWVY